MKECEYYPTFEKWLVNDWKFKELKGEGSTFNNVYVYYSGLAINEFDVLGLYRHANSDNISIYSIEVKLNDFDLTLGQALKRSNICDFSYIAFPINWYFGSMLERLIANYEVLKNAKIGLLVYDELRRKIWVVKPAHKKTDYKKYPKFQKYRLRLEEELSRLKASSQFKQQKLKVV